MRSWAEKYEAVSAARDSAVHPWPGARQASASSQAFSAIAFSSRWSSDRIRAETSRAVGPTGPPEGVARAGRGARLLEPLPLVEQARVHLAHRAAQALQRVVDLLVPVALGHGLDQRLVGVARGSAAARPRCAAARTRARSRRRSRSARACRAPRTWAGCSPWPTHGCFAREGVEGVVDEVAVRLGVLELLELLHPLVVLDALGLQLGQPSRP